MRSASWSSLTRAACRSRRQVRSSTRNRPASAPRRSRSPSSSRMAPASRSPARRFDGRSGASATRCTRAKASSSTPSATRTRDASGRFFTVRHSRRWPCPMAIPTGTGAGAAPSTSANTAWAASPARSRTNTDAPANATLIDVTFAGDDGKSYVLPRAVGIYERDGGLLWKHYESYSKTNESRRARKLVIFFIATIGNYDYSINWIFHQDGVLELDSELSGIMLPKGVRETKAAGHGATLHIGPPRLRERRRAASPALLQLQARLRRGWSRQLGPRDEHAGDAGRRGESLDERHDHGGDAAGHRSAGRSGR